MKDKVIIYDTTLRDGMQGTEIHYNVEDKIQIAKQLDAVGIDYIEGGFPMSSEKEAEFFRRIQKENLKNARVAAFGSTRKPNAKPEDDAHIKALLDVETPTVTIVGKTWKAHVEKVLGTDLEENLRMVSDSIEYIKKHGREVIFDLEHFFDGYKDDPEYAVKVLKAGSDAGADCLCLCDTNGGVLPHEVIQIMKELPQDKLASIGLHFHNDTGNATANSIVGVTEGARHVQVTVNGWGERCGNANLCSVVPNLVLKMDYDAHIKPHIKHLTSLSRFVSEKANIIPDKRQPYVGEAAFSHKAGQHVDVLSKAETLMEHMDASLVGNTRKILLSELAGKSTVVGKLQKYGNYTKQDSEVTELTKQLKQKEMEGYEYEAAEASFDLLIRQALGRYTPMLELNNYHLESFKTGTMPAKTVGRIFLRIDGLTMMGASVGTGPVEVLDHALRNALSQTYPWLDEISLIDYRVRVLNPEEASAAKVRVFITTTDGKQSWDTVGVSENIVEASWEATVASLEFYYNNFILDQ